MIRCSLHPCMVETAKFSTLFICLMAAEQEQVVFFANDVVPSSTPVVAAKSVVVASVWTNAFSWIRFVDKEIGMRLKGRRGHLLEIFHLTTVHPSFPVHSFVETSPVREISARLWLARTQISEIVVFKSKLFEFNVVVACTYRATGDKYRGTKGWYSWVRQVVLNKIWEVVWQFIHFVTNGLSIVALFNGLIWNERARGISLASRYSIARSLQSECDPIWCWRGDW